MFHPWIDTGWDKRQGNLEALKVSSKVANGFNKILVQGKYSRKIKIELSSENAGLKASIMIQEWSKEL